MCNTLVQALQSEIVSVRYKPIGVTVKEKPVQIRAFKPSAVAAISPRSPKWPEFEPLFVLAMVLLVLTGVLFKCRDDAKRLHLATDYVDPRSGR